MSNRVAVQICKFTDYSMDKVPLEDHWGYRIYDDYGQSYNNIFETLDDVYDELDPEGILLWVETKHPEFYESVLNKNGLYFCDTWLDITEQMADDQQECYGKKEY